MMRESGSMMAESVPPQFKLEREVTLMPSEFRERMSAKHKSRKSSAGTTGTRRSNGHAPTSGRLRYRTENSFVSTYRSEPSPQPDTKYVTSVKFTDKRNRDSEDHYGHYLDESGELKSTTSHIELNGEFKMSLDNAYANSNSEGGFNVKTPPTNLQIKDLMIPLDDWSGGDTIHEKKYTVLPSIKNKRSARSDNSETSRQFSSVSSEYSINNQLDFYRDKIEEEADFFADFRVNTSTVKATPRQDPLPPIKQETVEKESNKKSQKKSQKLLSDRQMKNTNVL